MSSTSSPMASSLSDSSIFHLGGEISCAKEGTLIKIKNIRHGKVFNVFAIRNYLNINFSLVRSKSGYKFRFSVIDEDQNQSGQSILFSFPEKAPASSLLRTTVFFALRYRVSFCLYCPVKCLKNEAMVSIPIR